MTADYHFAAFDGINRNDVRGEDSELLARLCLPLKVLDNYVAYRHVKRYEGLGPMAIFSAHCVQKLSDVAGF
ncbi:MAG TPA: hypothetical protein VGX76_15375 [Pirellulales bacterium]|nr:hypothetical protein [Pirellulales bacterium]